MLPRYMQRNAGRAQDGKPHTKRLHLHTVGLPERRRLQLARETQKSATTGGRDVPPILTSHTDAILAQLRAAGSVNGSFSSKMIAYHMGWTDRDGRSIHASPGKLIRPSLCLWAC